ncbi:AzlD domain-containing protein [Aureimonas fodinaquatilis]|uniref:AzlD domain-containing protein n=1 Tax=Aureimonas fodinaquatilis TaxID=2565783 RepID=A0A5B0DUQ4_9HYPH|nr:AzlD domain-containing protein [Aureimonas fodinaquatilis]KAA0970504.1 AzlD domain-containing protein [Aureimonas fodinaquatilis]
MTEWTFFSYGVPWWPYLFILLAGWLPTDIWRFLGVVSSGRISETSPAIALVRAIATALVAAVIARLVLYPGGTLEAIPMIARVGAVAGGFAAYLLFRRSVILGIIASQCVLQFGAWWAGLI